MYVCERCGETSMFPKTDEETGVRVCKCGGIMYPAYECNLCGQYQSEILAKHDGICNDCFDRLMSLFKEFMSQFSDNERDEMYYIIDRFYDYL